MAFQEWGKRKWTYKRSGNNNREECYPFCPDCVHHDAHLLCRICLRWFCHDHFGEHAQCLWITMPRLNALAKGGF